MREIHPLGKSPMLRDGDALLLESGSIVEHLVARHGEGRLAPGRDHPERTRYLFFLHWVEGSLMSLLVTEMLLSGAIPGVDAGPLGPGMREEVRRMIAWLDDDMAGREFSVGEAFSAADAMLAYALTFADSRGFLEATEHLGSYLARMKARGAWRRAVARSA